MPGSLYSVVTTPAGDRALITLEDLREELSILPSNTSVDGYLGKVIVRVSGHAERYCKRVFAVQGYTDTFVPPQYINPDEPLRVAQSPILQDPPPVVTVDGQVLDLATVTVDYQAGFFYQLETPWSGNAITIAYTAGFAELPEDLQQAVLDLAVMEYRGRGRDPMLRGRESPGLGREEYWIGGATGGAGIPEDIAKLLNPYRRVFNG
jgi:hypothetical protein